MPLGTPIDELILQELKTTVAAITAGATYANSVSSCVIDEPSANPPIADMLCIIGFEDPEIEENRPHQAIGWLQNFWVSCDVKVSEASSTSVRTRLNEARADIETALMVDSTRGARARSLISPPQYVFDPESKQGTVIVNLEVRYRTAYNNPRTLIG